MTHCSRPTTDQTREKLSRLSADRANPGHRIYDPRKITRLRAENWILSSGMRDNEIELPVTGESTVSGNSRPVVSMFTRIDLSRIAVRRWRSVRAEPRDDSTVGKFTSIERNSRNAFRNCALGSFDPRELVDFSINSEESPRSFRAKKTFLFIRISFFPAANVQRLQFPIAPSSPELSARRILQDSKYAQMTHRSTVQRD